MAGRRVLITLLTDHTQEVTIPEREKLEEIVLNSSEDFIVLPTADGGEFAFRKSQVLSMAKAPKGHGTSSRAK